MWVKLVIIEATSLLLLLYDVLSLLEISLLCLDLTKLQLLCLQRRQIVSLLVKPTLDGLNLGKFCLHVIVIGRLSCGICVLLLVHGNPGEWQLYLRLNGLRYYHFRIENVLISYWCYQLWAHYITGTLLKVS